VGGGLIGHCVSPQPWREIDASEHCVLEKVVRHWIQWVIQ